MEKETIPARNPGQQNQKPIVQKIFTWVAWLYIPVFLVCYVPLEILKQTDSADLLLIWFGAGTIIIPLFLFIFIIVTLFTKQYKKYSLNGLTAIFILYMVIFGAIIGTPRSARDKARDAQRRSDIAQVRTALSGYHDDYSTYPAMQANNGAGPDSSGDVLKIGATTNSIFDENGPLINTYLAQVVSSPTENSGKKNTTDDKDHYFYLTPMDSTPTAFVLFTQLEANNNNYYYAMNNEGTIWDYQDKKIERPTCVTGRLPVCGY